MTTLENSVGYDFTCSVLRRHNCLAHDWYYEPDGLTKRSQDAWCSGEATTTGIGRSTATVAAAAGTAAVASASDHAAAVASAANAAANASSGRTAAAPTRPIEPAATASATPHQHAHGHATATAKPAAPVAAATAATPSSEASGAARSLPPVEEERNRGGAPWLLGAAGLATVALAGLFFYKGMSVKAPDEAKVAPAPAAITKPEVAEAPAAKTEEKAAEAEAPKVAASEAPEAPAEAAPAGEPGVTNYYGVSDPSRVMAWSSEATFNPDYSAEPAPAPAAAEEAAPAEAAPAAETAAAEPAPEPAPEPVAELPKGEPGVTSYYGIAEKADATQTWAADAAMNPDYTAEAPAAEAAPAAPEPAPAAAAEPAPEPVVEAELPKGEPGVTSYYGIAEKADATQPWAAEAAMNPDYTAEAPAAEPAPAPAAAAEPAPEPAAELPKGEPGVTSYYGIAEKADATQTWAAPATVYAEPAAPASPAANACHDALTAALKAGKLNFATSSWEITPDSNSTLDNIAKLAKACEGVSIEIGGHTDSTGSTSSNKVLSEQRAKAVVRYLTSAGVEASKLTAVGYGQDKPVASNDTAEGRRENRRIEFTVTSK